MCLQFSRTSSRLRATAGVPLPHSNVLACHDGYTRQMMSLEAGSGCASDRDWRSGRTSNSTGVCNARATGHMPIPSAAWDF